MDIKTIYQDENLLVVDKPAGISVFSAEEKIETLIKYLLVSFPKLKDIGEAPRYGMVHRLDKDTSGALLIAKNEEALNFLQREFKERRVFKRYIALCVGDIAEKDAVIETLMTRSPRDRRRQKAYSLDITSTKGKTREAKTTYRVLKKFQKYTLIEVVIQTGRKHQIRCHLSHIHHPLAGDNLYGFKNQPQPEGLSRHFLHAEKIKINLPNKKEIEFHSKIPNDLIEVLNNLKI